MKKAVYITGAGIVSALGIGKEATWQSIHTHHSGIARVKYLPTLHSEFPVGEVKQNNREMIEHLNLSPEQPISRTTLMGIMAVAEALQQAEIDKRRHQRIAFISGTTVGGMDNTERYYRDYLTNNNKDAFIRTHDCGNCTETIADFFSLFSYITSVSTACSSAANSILLGSELIESNRADIVVAGGSECLTKLHLNGFRSLMILSTDICSPFDANTNGLNLGEGAGYIVLESEESVRQRGIVPLAILTGGGNACDAYHQTATSPEGNGPYAAMKLALEHSGLSCSDIDYINAHGTGTPNNDLTEGIAFKRLFGNNIPPFSSTKAYTGHTTSASGSIEAVISLLALQHQEIPVNLNFHEPMSGHGLIPALEGAPSRPLQHVLSNSFGFGGNDTSLIFSKL